MKFTYLKTPLHRYTFKAPKIRLWVERMVEGKVLNLFAGMTVLNCDETRNDLNPEMVSEYNMDALEFALSWEGEGFDTIILDPPYSYRKSMEMYDGKVASPFNRLKDALMGILADTGIVITFGYHSISMGNKRGFEQEEILLMYHGGAIHDTIVVVERRKKKVRGFFEGTKTRING